MLTSKQRAQLRAQANPLKPVVHIGKEGITQSVIDQTRETLLAHELIKCRVLETALFTANEAADVLAAATGADFVCATGATFVIYKDNPNKDNPKHAVAKVKRNPVREGAKARAKKRQLEREKRNEFFKAKAIEEKEDTR